VSTSKFFNVIHGLSKAAVNHTTALDRSIYRSLFGQQQYDADERCQKRECREKQPKQFTQGQ
jgi:hypothetical protein